MSSKRSRLLVLCLSAVFALLAQSAFATHFRYGYMFWERDLNYSNPANPNEVRILVTVEAGGRWTYPSWNPVVPPTGLTVAARCTSGVAVCCSGVVTTAADASTLSCPNPGTLINFAGGTVNSGIAFDSPQGGTVTVVGKHGITLVAAQQQTFPVPTIPYVIGQNSTAVLPMDVIVSQTIPAQDTFYGRFTLALLMDKTKKLNMSWSNANRISQLLDGNNDLPWLIKSTIDLTGANANVTKSPKTTSSPVVTVFSGQNNIVDLPGSTFDNFVARWRLATPAESGLFSASPMAPSVFSLDPATGRVNFKPRAPGFYAVQFVMEEVDPATNTVKASVPLDLMFNAVTSTGTYSETLATSDGQTTYTATVPQPITYTIRSTTAPANAAYNVSINHSVLPPGASFTQPVCSGNAVCAGIFSWTPTVTSTASVVCYNSTLSSGQTLIAQSQQMCVTVNLNPLATQLTVDAANGVAGGGPLVLTAHLKRVLDNAPLGSRSVTFSYDAAPNNPPWVGDATVLTDATGTATAHLTTVRAVDPASPFTATFNAIQGELLQSSSAGSVLSVKSATTSLNAPTVGTAPAPSVGYPLPVSVVLNRIFTDGGIYGVGAMVDVTLTPPTGSPATISAGPTGLTGVATATFPGPATTGTYQASAYFATNDALIGNVSSPVTVINVRQRTQVTMSAGVASQNVSSPVQATLVAMPAGTPLAGRSVKFSTAGFSDVIATTDAAGVATANFNWPTLGAKTVTATYAPSTTELNRDGLESSDTSSATITVQPAAVTTTTVTSGTTAVAGQPVPLSVHVQSGGSPVPAGGAVSFTIGGADTVDTTTNSNGDATGNYTPAAAGSTSYVATYQGAAGFAPSTSATTPLTIGTAASSLAPLTVNAVDFVGNSLSVATTLSRTSAPSGVIANGAVTFTLTGEAGNPGGPTTQTIPATTDGSGVAQATFVLNARGAFTLTASYAGNGSQSAATRGANLAVYQKTSLLVNAAHGAAGDATSVTAGLMALPANTPIAGANVNFDFSNVVSSGAAVTDSNGVATLVSTFPVAGTFPVTASFSNLAAFYVDANGAQLPTTASGTVDITTVATSLAPFANASTGFVGDNVAVVTTLTRITAPSGTLANRPVVFTATPPAGSPVVQTVMTDSNGQAVSSLLLAQRGEYTINASFSGDGALQASSTSAALNVYQKTQVTLTAPATVIAGTQVPLSATLTAVPGSGIAGESVTFSFGGVIPDQTVTTGAGGVATTTVSFPAAGPANVAASFDGVANNFANHFGQLAVETDASAIAVTAAATTLSSIAAPSAGLVGNAIAVSTTLGRVDGIAIGAGQSIVFTITAPGGSTTQVAAQTDAAGHAAASFTPQQRGVHSVTAAFAAAGSLLGAASAPANVDAYQRTALTLSNLSATAGGNATLTAMLTTVPGGVAVSGQNIQFSSSVFSVTSGTGAGGDASQTVVFPQSGTVPVTATFSNAADFFTNSAGDIPAAATTATASATITSAATSLSAVTVAASANLGNTIAVSTLLTRISAPAGGVAGETVNFTVTDPDGGTSLSGSATTMASGAVSYSFTPALRGVYTVSASYAGNAALEASSANAANVTVYQRTTLTVPTVNALAAKLTTVSATLTDAPGGAPVAGQAVAFSFSNGDWATATTDSLGVAQVTETFAAVGDYTVTATFSNAAGFYADSTGAFPVVATVGNGSVHVTNTPPTIADLPDITASATSAAGRVVNFTSTGSDAEDGALTPVCTAASGTFPIGATNVSCTVTDVVGATATDSFTITITNNAPTFTAPVNISLAATSAAGRAVSFTATGSDIEDGTLHADCEARSGETFPLGTTNIACTVTDVAGATASGSFSITITNNAPTILDLPNLSGEATSAAGRAFTFTSTGNDLEDGALTPVCSATSGTFPIGTTTVSCTVTDVAGATASDAFTITVNDTTAPAVTVSSITVEQTSPAGAIGTYAFSATDIVDGALTPSCLPASGSTFPRGATTVTCTTTDAHGNTGTASATVTVQDTIKPVVTYTGNAGTYSADQTVNITCAATDSGSGVAATTCANITGPAYSFAVGANNFSATATDVAGNTNSASTTFTVTVPAAALGNVIDTLVDSPAVAATLNHTLNLAAGAPNANARASHLDKMIKDINKEIGRSLTAAEAATLINLIQQLY
jgi:hypothetical protein